MRRYRRGKPMNKHIEKLSTICADLYSDCAEAFTEVEAGWGDRDVLAQTVVNHHAAERALDAAYTHAIRIFDQERRGG